MNKFPTISIVIPTLNEEKNIRKCLTSIFMQKYPGEKVEVIVVDNYSSDKTLKIAQEFPVTVFKNKVKSGEVSKMVGFKKAKNELVLYLDADIELRGENWLQKMVKPLIKNPELIGSFTKYYSKENTPAIERYLNFDPIQRDSIYQFFSPGIEKMITEKKNGYYLCEYTENKIPPAGLCLYRREKVLDVVESYRMFLELDFLVLLVRNGLNKFAYVPNAGLYHHHTSSLRGLIKKRMFNLNKVYLGRDVRFYKWFDLSKPKDKIKIAAWVIYANLFLPSVFVGIWKVSKYRDIAGLYEPVVNLLITDALILSIITSKKGRNLIFDG